METTIHCTKCKYKVLVRTFKYQSRTGSAVATIKWFCSEVEEWEGKTDRSTSISYSSPQPSFKQWKPNVFSLNLKLSRTGFCETHPRKSALLYGVTYQKRKYELKGNKSMRDMLIINFLVIQKNAFASSLVISNY